MMNESTNIPEPEDLKVSPKESKDQKISEIYHTSPREEDEGHSGYVVLEHPLDEDDVLTTDPDITERYWLESSRLYQISLDRGELFENSEDIKPVKGLSEYECFASTRIGGRKENQDTAAFRFTDRGLLLVVCDGMGGGPSGKRASFLAAHVISKFVGQSYNKIPDAELLEMALQEAHNVLKFDMSRHPENIGMGTTAAVLLINKEYAVLAHVGDSRIYQVRDGKLIFRTIDHSLVARKMQFEGWTDEEARTSDESNVITQAIGHRDIEPDIDIRPYVKGDRFLICTDGVWGHFPQKHLLKIMSESCNPGGALSDLMVTTDNIGIEEGNRHDNFTAIIAQTKISSKSEDAMTKFSKLCICILGILLLVSITFNIIQCKRWAAVPEAPQAEENAASAIVQETPIEFGSTLVIASVDTPKVQEPAFVKHDTIYIIKDGDIVSKIAKRFNVSIEEIKKANPDIDMHNVKIGQSILIPLIDNKK